MKGSLEKIFTKKLKKKIILVASIVILVLIIVAAVILMWPKAEEVTADTEYLVSTLTKASELTTAKLHYNGVTIFEDDGVALINKSGFIMMYEAEARIGIDVKQVEIRADDDNQIIYVKIPKAVVQDVHVDASSIQYFDQEFSLFNADQKEDVNEAIAIAEEKAQAEITGMGVLEMANEQAAALIKGILIDAVPAGYKIVISE